MFNNKFWSIMAITLFSILCCLGSVEETQKLDKKYTYNLINETMINSIAVSLDNEIKKAEELKCPWDENTIFNNYYNVDYNIPCLIYTEAVEQGYKDYANLMVSISIWETGWFKSDLFINNHNYGGLRGNNGWLSYNSTEEGAKEYVSIVINNYIVKGYDDAYKMQNRYAGGSTTWANNVIKINNILDNL